jgi:respiratory burst oxidase
MDDTEDNSGKHRVGGAMLPIFLIELRREDDQDTVEVTLKLEEDSIVVCSATPTMTAATEEVKLERFLARSLFVRSRIRRKELIIMIYRGNGGSAAARGDT